MHLVVATLKESEIKEGETEKHNPIAVSSGFRSSFFPKAVTFCERERQVPSDENLTPYTKSVQKRRIACST